MIHIAETVGVGSIENFLSTAERNHLAELMYDVVHADDSARFGSERSTSIHEIPGHSPEDAMVVYEPAGRIEIPTIPEAADKFLGDAFERARPALSRIMPSITLCRPWTYVEYGVGQHITSHLDGIAPDPFGWPRQIAGISVVISQAEAGGDFYVETTSSDLLWCEQAPDAAASGYADGMWLAHDGADNSSDWFREMPRTRWSVAPAPGTALLYGSQLTHGTLPVTAGRVAKFISWLIAEPPEMR
ncbi:hypothetical protein AB0J25_14095 [Streptomyces sp. NPDC049910]|uniref:hypothetical protein n=1 Tax=Streptomyces sp. NPDC049910 TaxID=3155278 RepID=UPI00344739F0